jgi:aryl-alcohol dehydrogenase
VLVRIAGVGICHTDLASRDGNLGAPFPSIFGHEGAGVVTAMGDDVTKLKVGDHVVLAPDSDGTCPLCQAGDPMYCDHFTDLNLQTDVRGRLRVWRTANAPTSSTSASRRSRTSRWPGSAMP